MDSRSIRISTLPLHPDLFFLHGRTSSLKEAPGSGKQGLPGAPGSSVQVCGVMGMEHFRHRAEAGEILSKHLSDMGGKEDTVVLGLARGGVPVALRVAQALDCPMDVFQVRKLGVPGLPHGRRGRLVPGFRPGLRPGSPGMPGPGSPAGRIVTWGRVRPRKNRGRGSDPSRKMVAGMPVLPWKNCT